MKGFSLIELLITVAIVTILAAIGYPSYIHHIARTKRYQAQAALLATANRLEEYHALNASYQRASVEKLLPQQAQQLPYHFHFSQLGKFHYRIDAIAKPKQAYQDAGCSSLGIDDTGKRYSNQAGCWR